MSTIRAISYADIANSIDIYYFGWPDDELVIFREQYQSKFYGSVNDARFEIIDDAGNIYYAIFRTPAEDEWFVKKSKDYLLFNDQNRVLLNIGGKLYRYLIKERKVLDNSCYTGIICNDFKKPKSPYFHSIVSFDHEIMLIIDSEGIAAINWNNILWKQKFEWADCGHLELSSIEDNQVVATYEDSFEDKEYSISFNLLTGKYEMKLL